MKTLSLITALAITIATPAFAAKGAKAAGRAGHAAFSIAKIDKDGNHKIEGDEVTALKDAFAKLPADSKIRKRLDANANGTLEENEIAALNARLAKRAEKAGAPAAKKHAHKKKAA